MPGAVLDERLVHHQMAVHALYFMQQVFHLIPGEGRAHRVQRIAQVDQRALEQRVLQLNGRVAEHMIFAQQACLAHGQVVSHAEHLVLTEAGRGQQRTGSGELGREIDGGDAARRGQHLRRIEVQVFGQRHSCAAHLRVGVVADVLHARRQCVPHPPGRALRPQVGGVIQPVRGPFTLPDVSTVVHFSSSTHLPSTLPWPSTNTISI